MSPLRYSHSVLTLIWANTQRPSRLFVTVSSPSLVYDTMVAWEAQSVEKKTQSYVAFGLTNVNNPPVSTSCEQIRVFGNGSGSGLNNEVSSRWVKAIICSQDSRAYPCQGNKIGNRVAGYCRLQMKATDTDVSDVTNTYARGELPVR